MTHHWRTLASAAVVACLAASLAAVPRPSAVAAGSGSERTFRLAPLAGGADLPNPLRGQYRWLGAEPTPATATSHDDYYRDQVYWGRIEKADNVWDFTWLEVGLAEARGGKFGFRVMAYCPGCWMEGRADLPAVTPSFRATYASRRSGRPARSSPSGARGPIRSSGRGRSAGSTSRRCRREACRGMRAP